MPARHRKPYPTDLNDAEWDCLAAHLPATSLRGRPREHPVREVFDAIFYVVRGGCAWRLLPHDFPPWSTIYYWFRRWRLDGLWHRIVRSSTQSHQMKRGPTPGAFGGHHGQARVCVLQRSPEVTRATTQARKSLAASDICWWTPPVFY